MSLTLQGVRARFLLDTGANVTVISPSLLATIPETLRPEIVETRTELTVADGRRLPMFGRGTFQIQLGSTLVDHEVWVANIDLEESWGWILCGNMTASWS